MADTTAVILDLAVAQGVTANALKKWRARGKVPGKYHLQIVEAARQKGIPLSREDFDFRSAKPRKRGRAA